MSMKGEAGARKPLKEASELEEEGGPSVRPAAPRSAKHVKEQTMTCTLINFVGMMEKMDELVLPAASSYVACAFKIGPKDLGSITFWRAVVQALASPFGGLAGHSYNRLYVIFVGCTIWGLCTLLFSLCNTVQEGRMVWAINGIGLSLIIPNSQSLIADYYPASQRGYAFGILHLTAGFGGMLGSLYATNIGPLNVFGIEGWRFSFASIAVVSFLTGLLTFLFGTDPRFTGRQGLKVESSDNPEQESLLKGQGEHVDMSASEQARSLAHVGEEMNDPALPSRPITWRRLMRMLGTPTFVLIIFQGVVGTMPWNTMVFFTLYFQLLGMNDFAASTLMCLLLAGNALGSLLGGWIGDRAAAYWPNGGRIFITQCSVAMGIPLSVLIIHALPNGGEPLTVMLYGIVLSIFGLIIPWAAPACNNPIFSEIVPEDMRNLIYAFDRSLEGALAAMSAFMVGWAAEQWYGFEGVATAGCDDVDGVSSDVRHAHTANAKSLGDAMLLFMVWPWAIAVVIYTGLYWTYPKDRDRARASNKPGALELPEEKIS